MGCIKLHILDEQYKRTEMQVSYFNKELTSNFCTENPRKWTLVNRIDPTGMYIVGIDGKPVIYDEENEWSANASSDVQKIGNAMMRTPEGKKVFNDMAATEYGITMNYKEGFHPEDRDKLGETKIKYDGDGKVTDVTINLFDGKIKENIAEYQHSNQSGRQEPAEYKQVLSEQAPTMTERIGQVGAHEGTHATNPQAMPYRINASTREEKKRIAEIPAVATEMKVIRQTTEFNRPIRPRLYPLRTR
jgi:hypothetical protein